MVMRPSSSPSGVAPSELRWAAAGLHGAFVFTFVAPSYPTHATDPGRDLDSASYALVRTWPDGRMEPKAAFHAVADYFAVRKAA